MVAKHHRKYHGKPHTHTHNLHIGIALHAGRKAFKIEMIFGKGRTPSNIKDRFLRHSTGDIWFYQFKNCVRISRHYGAIARVNGKKKQQKFHSTKITYAKLFFKSQRKDYIKWCENSFNTIWPLREERNDDVEVFSIVEWDIQKNYLIPHSSLRKLMSADLQCGFV